MSVRLLDRNESRVEFLSNFHNLRRDIEILLMRDFGLKKRKYEIALMEEIYQMTEEDKRTYENLMTKIGAKSSLIDKYPTWLVENWRSAIMRILDKLGIELELANSIYATTAEEMAERRLHWDNSIGYCNALKDKFQDVIYCIKTDVTLGSYADISNRLSKQINLIKGVRKSDLKKGFRC